MKIHTYILPKQRDFISKDFPMGGSIGVTILDPQGQIHRMCRWTNSLPWFIVNLDLCKKDPQHLEDYLSQWKIMRQDWLDNRGRLEDGACWKEIDNYCGKSNGPFEHNMTTSYAPYPYCAPTGYGLVFIDMVSDQIIHSQGYTGFSRLPGVSFRLADDSNSDSERLKTLVEAGRFPRYFVNSQKDPKKLETRNWKEITALINRSETDKCWLRFDLDLSPFKVTNYEEYNLDAHQKMKKHVESLIALTDDDEKAWVNWFDHLKECAEENED